MAKIRNLVFQTDDAAELKRLEEEYRFIGRPVRVEGDKLIVLALPDTAAKKRPRKKSYNRPSE